LAAELQKLAAIDLDFDFDRHQLLEADARQGRRGRDTGLYFDGD